MQGHAGPAPVSKDPVKLGRFMKVGFFVWRLGLFCVAADLIIVANGPGAALDPSQRWPAWALLSCAAALAEFAVRPVMRSYLEGLERDREIEERWAREEASGSAESWVAAPSEPSTEVQAPAEPRREPRAPSVVIDAVVQV